MATAVTHLSGVVNRGDYYPGALEREEELLQRQLPTFCAADKIESLVAFAIRYGENAEVRNAIRLIFQAHEIYQLALARDELQNVFLFLSEYHLYRAFFLIEHMELADQFLNKMDLSARLLQNANDRSQAILKVTEIHIDHNQLEAAREIALLSPMPTQFREVVSAFGSLFLVAKAYIGVNNTTAQQLLDEIKLRASNLHSSIEREVVAAVTEVEQTIVVQQLGNMALRG